MGPAELLTDSVTSAQRTLVSIPANWKGWTRSQRNQFFLLLLVDDSRSISLWHFDPHPPTFPKGNRGWVLRSWLLSLRGQWHLNESKDRELIPQGVWDKGSMRGLNLCWPLEQKFLSFIDILCALSECPESEQKVGDTEKLRWSTSNTYWMNIQIIPLSHKLKDLPI